MAGVLLVDTDDQFRRHMAVELVKLGHEVTEAVDRRSAFKALAARLDRPVEVLVANLEIPRSDGVELIEGLRPSWPTLAIVAITEGREETVPSDHADGADVLLSRPFSPRQLSQAVGWAIGVRNSARYMSGARRPGRGPN